MNKNKESTPALSGQYVRDYYNDAVGKMDKPYADFRWFSSPYALAEYAQTKRAIRRVLGGREFDSVLEVGGGDGVWTELLLNHSGSITELDISEEMLRGAKAKFSDRANMRFVRGDFAENDLPSGEYDLIYAIRCFEYFPDKQKAASEMYRLLKPRGQVLLVTKNPYYLKRKKGGEKALHQGQISQEELLGLLVLAGFVVLKSGPAILGKKFGFLPARVLWAALQAVSLSGAGFLVPGFLKKYFSESYLVLAQRSW